MVNMNDSYNGLEGAEEYINFINSEDGLIEQKFLWNVISSRLSAEDGKNLLDAACGQGWLTAKLAEKFGTANGCDGSKFLIDYANAHYSSGKFLVADVCDKLPYPEASFSAIILNMAAHDLRDQKTGFKNLFSALRPGGKLIMTIANPYYAYPVGVWKRGIIGRLLFKKPSLKVRPYNLMQKDFVWGKHLKPHFYPLSEQINNVLSAGFNLTHFQDLKSLEDSPSFNLQYQLHRFPHILLLEFKRP